jgi:nucleotide-binding universal stress UspA family protein
MKTIVVGYDGSEEAGRALERASELGSAFKAKLVVTSIAPLLGGGPRSGGPMDPADSPEMHKEQLEQAKSVLESKKLKDAEYVEATGDPHKAIVAIAEERDADLIVVGSRELGAMERLLHQSVSASVSRNAKCDVLIVH